PFYSNPVWTLIKGVALWTRQIESIRLLATLRRQLAGSAGARLDAHRRGRLGIFSILGLTCRTLGLCKRGTGARRGADVGSADAGPSEQGVLHQRCGERAAHCGALAGSSALFRSRTTTRGGKRSC